MGDPENYGFQSSDLHGFGTRSLGNLHTSVPCYTVGFLFFLGFPPHGHGVGLPPHFIIHWFPVLRWMPWSSRRFFSVLLVLLDPHEKCGRKDMLPGYERSSIFGSFWSPIELAMTRMFFGLNCRQNRLKTTGSPGEHQDLRAAFAAFAAFAAQRKSFTRWNQWYILVFILFRLWLLDYISMYIYLSLYIYIYGIFPKIFSSFPWEFLEFFCEFLSSSFFRNPGISRLPAPSCLPKMQRWPRTSPRRSWRSGSVRRDASWRLGPQIEAQNGWVWNGAFHKWGVSKMVVL